VRGALFTAPAVLPRLDEPDALPLVLEAELLPAPLFTLLFRRGIREGYRPSERDAGRVLPVAARGSAPGGLEDSEGLGPVLSVDRDVV